MRLSCKKPAHRREKNPVSISKPHPALRATFSNELEKDTCGAVGSFDCGRGGAALFLVAILLFPASAHAQATGSACATNGVYAAPSSDGKIIQCVSGTWVATSANSQWTTSGSNIYYNSGSVGIGTTAPGAALDVNGVIAGRSNILASENQSNWFGLEPEQIESPAHGSIVNEGMMRLVQFNLTSPYTAAFAGGATFNGNVGIGTTSPGNVLSVELGRGSTVSIANAAARIGGSDVYTYMGSLSGNPYSTWLQSMRVSDSAVFPMVLNPNGGYVGIGTVSPGYLLHVNGTAYASGAAGALSDIRHKDNVKPLPEELANVMNLRPVSFKWKEPTDDGMKGEQIGFIAQEVEPILPSVVLTQNDKDKTKGLKYTEIIPVLTKAIQELKINDDALRADFDAYKKAHP